jgi:hypothetical protein
MKWIHLIRILGLWKPSTPNTRAKSIARDELQRQVKVITSADWASACRSAGTHCRKAAAAASKWFRQIGGCHPAVAAKLREVHPAQQAHGNRKQGRQADDQHVPDDGV